MIVSLKEILQDAYASQYAVGAFNCISLENAIGAIQAAEDLRSPIILQLAEVHLPITPMELIAPIYLELARNASVPVAVHLDHGQSFDVCARAMKYGFGSVMFDGASLPTNQNIAITRQVTQMAKAFGVSVEAELGKVGDTGIGEGEGTGSADTADVFTDVEESADFITATGVDALAIAIGNLHGKYVGTPTLNIQRLKEISQRNNLPLVLHGGTGTSEADFKACIHNGISKINVATAIQLAVNEKLQPYYQTTPVPSYQTVTKLITQASKEIVEYHMQLFESAGKA